ncbi:MAG: glycosyltransferase [Planctomycetes bacterium]|nr:glycosyltransferase [Planctomycetota bacterium]MBI3847706.1 glycosyltransferase [Planctomycetota bacterium]
MSTPQISVVVRTFNRPHFLREALASVAAQTYRDFETIVVNDGGADVESVIRPVAEGARVRYFHLTKKVGRCAAGNLAIREAKGKWIAYLDDDDLFYSDHLQTHVDFFEKNPDFHATYSDANEALQRRRPDGTYEVVARELKLSYEFHPLRFFMHAFIHLVTFVHEKSLAEKLGGFDESLEVLEDLDLMFRFAQDHWFGHIKKVTAEYRIRDDQSNAVTKLREEFLATRERLFQKYFHVALPFIMTQVLERDDQLDKLSREIAELRAEVAALRVKGESSGGLLGKLFS